MKKSIKRLFLLLAVVTTAMICLVFSASAADSGKCGANVNYTYNSTTGELVVSGSGAMYDYSYAVATEDSSPFRIMGIKSIVIESGVTRIGEYAFGYCYMLTSVKIPDTVTQISNDAFISCNKLTNVTLPKNLKTIGNHAFASCTSLTSLTIPNGVTTIGRNAFSFCSSLVNVTIPNSVTSIGKYAFADCHKIANISVGQSNSYYSSDSYGALFNKSKTTLIKYPPYNSATSYVIPDSVKTIEYASFERAENLESITIPQSVTSIGDYSFRYCDNLKNIYYNGTKKNWENISVGLKNTALDTAIINYPGCSHIEENYAKYCDVCGEYIGELFKSDYCGSDVVYRWYKDGTVIISGKGAMWDNESSDDSPFYNSDIKSVIITDGVTTIGDYAFPYIRDSLTSVKIGNTVTEIGSNAFINCYNLSELTIGNSVTNIGSNAFYNCKALTEVVIPDSVTIIRTKAFWHCDNLKSVTIGAGVNSIVSQAFLHCNNIVDVFYNGTKSEWDEISIQDGNTRLTDAEINFMLCNHEDKNSDKFCDICLVCTKALVESGKCGDKVNYYWYDNNIVVISGSGPMWDYTNEEHSPFYSENINRLVVRGTVTRIGAYAFDYCYALKKLEIEEGVAEIGAYAFKWNDVLDNVVIPNSVTTLEEGAFYWSESINSVTIGSGVTTIGEKAFWYCDNLTDVTYIGMQEDWDAIDIGTGNDALLASEFTFICTHKRTTTESQKNPTCTESGYTEGVYCNACCTWLSGHEVISAKGHTDADSDKFCDDCNEYTEKLYESGLFGENISYKWYEDGVVFISGTGAMKNSALPFARSDIRSVVIEEGITSIGNHVFEYCDKLAYVSIADSVTTIGECAFIECGSLSEITIPDNVTVIGNYAFNSCDNLVSVTMGDSVTTIGFAAFENCDKLAGITMADSVTVINDYAFHDCNSLTEIVVPDSVTAIGNNAFSYCDNLANVSIGNSVTTIGKDAFYDCGSLTSVAIEVSVTTIGEDAFYNCTKLTDVYYTGTKSQWKKISIEAGNDYLTDATISYTCYHVDAISHPQENPTCTEAGYTEGLYCPDCEAWVSGHEVISAKGHTDTDSDKFCDECKVYTEVLLNSGTCGENVTYNWYEDGMLIISGEGAMADYDYSKSPFYKSDIKSIIIEDGISRIGANSFTYCEALESVVIPDSVSTIGAGAFEYCSAFDDISLPENITSIGAIAFYNTAYYADESNWYNQVLYIDKYLIEAKKPPNSYLSIHRIKEGTRVIADKAFAMCQSLATITIPDSVITIGDNAFYDCRSLKNVHYNGTTEQWEKINISDTAAVYLKNATIHYVCYHLNQIDYPQQDATCTEIGYTAGIYCPDCETWVSGHKEISLKGHSFTQYNYNGDATCTADGTKTAKCDNCDERSTLTAEGTKVAHSWSEWSTVKTPTCLESGTEERNCKNCTASESNTLSAINHKNKADYPQQDATCTVIGYTAGVYCSDCELWISGHTEISAKGHTYTESDKFCEDCNEYIEELYQSGSCGENVTYDWYKDGMLIISGEGSMNDYKWNGSPFYNSNIKYVIINNGLTAIGNSAFYDCTNLTGISIPDGVTTIGSSVFSGCSSLTDISIPEGVTSIGVSAFYDCTSLTDISIPEGVTSIGGSAFRECTSLTSISLPDSVTAVGEYVLYNTAYYNNESNWHNYVLYIDEYLIEAKKPPNVLILYSKIREGTKVVAEGAFASCSCLGSITIPDSVVTIGNSAFRGCDTFRTVYYGGSEEQWGKINIGKTYNDRLMNANIIYNSCIHPAAVSYSQKHPTCTEVGYTAGLYCPDCDTWLTGHSIISSKGHTDSDSDKFCDECNGYTEELYQSGSFGENVTYKWYKDGTVIISGKGEITDYTSYTYSPFYNSDIKTVIITDGITAIGDNLFCDCESLENITLPDSITSIGYNAFYNTAYYNNESNWHVCVLYIGEYLIDSEKPPYAYLQKYKVKEGTRVIADWAFSTNLSLSSITIPDSVVTIGENAFNRCDALKDVYYGGTEEQWEKINIGETNSAYLTKAKIHYTCTHLNVIEYSQQDETCTESGYTAGTYCPDCETWLSGHEEISSKGHSFTQYNYNGDATCTADGTKTAKCDNCDERSTLTAEGTKVAHSWSEWRTVKAPTCLESGTEERNCKNCSASESNTLSAINHENKIDYPQQDATCNEIGYTAGVYCPDCEKWLSGHAEIGKKEHSFTQYNYNDDATCAADGTKTAKCDNCDEKSTLTAEGTKTAHSWSEWSTVKAPTCLENGTEERNCENCTASESNNLGAINHKNKTEHPQQAATCKEIGYTAGVYCPDCEKWLSGHAEIGKKEHSFTQYKYNGDATVYADGTKTAKCDFGCENTDTVAANGTKLNLGAPSGFNVKSTTSSLTLNWSAAENATGYRIYYRLKNDTSWKVCVYYTTETTHTFSKLSAGVCYSFAVRSVAYNNEVALFGPYVTADTATQAIKPTVSATQNTSSITLTWSACPGATGYRIYYKSGDVWKISVSSTSSTTHSYTKLKAGAKYTFAIRPYIKNGNTVIWSDYVEFTTATIPASIAAKASSSAQGKITLSWSAVNGADGYQVYYKIGSGAYTLYKICNEAQTLTFSNLKSGTKYTFVVRAGIRTSGGNIYGAYTPVTVTVK